MTPNTPMPVLTDALHQSVMSLLKAAAEMRDAANNLWLANNPDEGVGDEVAMPTDEAQERHSDAFAQLQRAEYYAEKELNKYALLSASPQAEDERLDIVCRTCGGTGVDGDCGTDGGVIDVQCGICSGSGTGRPTATSAGELPAQPVLTVLTDRQILDAASHIYNLGRDGKGFTDDEAIAYFRALLSAPSHSVLTGDVIFRMRKFAEDLNLKAVADGFAGDEIGFKILDILDEQPEAKQAEDANRYVYFVEYLIGDRTDLDDAFVECKSKSDVDAIIDAAINEKGAKQT